MPSVMPEGEPAPGDGALPENARSEVSLRPLGIYVHVPFCTTRCGYCDFNTYTAAELGSGPGASRAGYVAAAIHELDLAARVLGPDAPVVSTIFVGGGTPTLLPPDDLGRLVTAVRDRFGLAEDAEVTTESNPESIDAAGLCRLRELGFNRISFGMQSVVPRVLATLDRTHSPGRSQRVVAEAKAAGFANTSLDLIYGTPGESLDDWLASIDAALAASTEHISAYALIVEEGTRLAARIRRGELPAPEDDDLSDKYLMAEERLTAAGHTAYEVSNWSTSPATRCRHNLGYWRGHHWWGIGPGAHSHVGGSAVVERQAPAGVRVTAGRRPFTVPSSRGAFNRSNGASNACCSSFGSPMASAPRCSRKPSRNVSVIFSPGDWRSSRMAC